nr:reverse transcriptase domain-containing protein [Tanacetum cinerariifolium]
MEAQYGKFLDMIRAVRINVPLVDVLARIPNYGKFLKELVSNKHKIKQISAAFLSDENSAILQNEVPPKLGDPRSFLIPCNFNKAFSCNALTDLGASINLMSIDVINEILEDFDALLDEDRKGTENVATDHLSQIENDETSDDSEVDDKFPGETLKKIDTRDEPWFTVFANYLVRDIIPKRMTYQQKNNFFSDLKHYFWEKPYLFKKLFCRFGMPKAVISDRGTHFCNKILEKTTKRYGVNHRFFTSYHPQTSGQVENINRALKRIIEKSVKDNLAIWSRKLDIALWDFRTAFKTPTGTSPYKLIYGKNYHLPFEIEHHAYWALKNCNPDLIAAGKKRMFQLHELDEFRHQDYETYVYTRQEPKSGMKGNSR